MNERFNKIKETVKSGAKSLGNKIKEKYDKIKAQKEFNKLKKEKQAFLISEFEKLAHTFTIHFNNGQTKDVKGLYDFDQKVLKIRDEIDKTEILYLKDKHQKYYIQEIDLNGDFFTCEYEGETLTLPLEKVIYTTEEPIKPVTNYIIDNSSHDTQTIKVKNSNINSEGASVETKNEFSAQIHLHKH